MQRSIYADKINIGPVGFDLIYSNNESYPLREEINNYIQPGLSVADNGNYNQDYFTKPIYLPQGKIIKKLIARGVVSSNYSNLYGGDSIGISVSIVAYEIKTGKRSNCLQVNLNNQSDKSSSNAGTYGGFQTVDNNKYEYYCYLVLARSNTFIGATLIIE